MTADRPLWIVAAFLTALVACGGADDPRAESGDVAGATPSGQEVRVPPGPAGGADLPSSDEISPATDEQSSRDVPAAAAGSNPSVSETPPVGGGQQPAPVGTEASDILDRAERAYAQVQSMEADFVQEVEVPLLESTRNSRGKIYHRTPDRFAMVFSDPDGDIIVADGRYVWMYYPSTDARQVMRNPLSGGQQVDLQREFLSNATERYDATRTGTESVGGRPAHALTLVPRGPSPYRRIRIWVDTQDFLVRRFEIIEANDSVRKLEMSNLRPNVTIPDEIFQFTPPPGTQVFDP